MVFHKNRVGAGTLKSDEWATKGSVVGRVSGVIEPLFGDNSVSEMGVSANDHEIVNRKKHTANKSKYLNVKILENNSNPFSV